jgi:peptidoglycan/LPS O-acetylase OafA/YrhL
MQDIVKKKVIKRQTFLPALTGVRFIAAFSVLVFHYGASFAEHSGLPGPLSNILHNGYLGVSLFFMLSGFILTYTHQEDQINGQFMFDFYMARFARIYPVYILALVIALPVLSYKLSLISAAKVLFMVQSWTLPENDSSYVWVMQAWTLSVELFFYILFPALLLVTKRLTAIPTGVVAAISAALIVIFGISSIAPGTLMSTDDILKYLPLPFIRTAEFVYGIMLCRLTVLYPGFSKVISSSLLEIFVITSILIIMAFTSDAQIKALVTILAGVLIVQLATGNGVVSTILSSKPLLLLGGASYSLYLLQGPVRAICDQIVPHPFDRFASPFITIIGSIVVFLFWEQPCRKVILSIYGSTRRKDFDAKERAEIT